MITCVIALFIGLFINFGAAGRAEHQTIIEKRSLEVESNPL